MTIFRDFSPSAAVAALVAVLVGFSGPFAIVTQAADAGHLTAGQRASWVWAIAVGSGVTSLALSWWTRMPVITAWSTPGAALLVTSLGDHPYRAAVGAFLFSAVAMTVIGLTGVFGRLIDRIPKGIVSALLAGILLQFVLHAFQAVPGAPVLTVAVIVVFVLAKRLLSRYAVLVALLVGVAIAAAQGQLDGLSQVTAHVTRPEFTMPAFSLSAVISIGIPMLLVTSASQNAPGLGVLRASGYTPDDRKLLGGTGIVSVLLAPFGSHAVNLAAITAAICTGPEAHPDPRRRYTAGVFYLLIGVFSAGLVQAFSALPKALIAVVAGVALLGAVLTGLVGAVEDVPAREAALITLAVTASGVTVLGVGSAFWGLLAGLAAHGVLTLRTRKRVSASGTIGA
ncbi:membrane protein [Longispora fulva]|uniref:Benzoate membrane transport protein n=1 Tax=Longispora fulva TaxID=619741 RepID=A0A8J7GP69_9ACTN|nr:benzoate/H(+) symporter BenE family transporter [Longispora fulva]MBG6135328.1 benzoate membrane transport protein [Longispora fulva]GIG56434.1 membrane protein [Longispora fulva]